MNAGPPQDCKYHFDLTFNGSKYDIPCPKEVVLKDLTYEDPHLDVIASEVEEEESSEDNHEDDSFEKSTVKKSVEEDDLPPSKTLSANEKQNDSPTEGGNSKKNSTKEEPKNEEKEEEEKEEFYDWKTDTKLWIIVGSVAGGLVVITIFILCAVCLCKLGSRKRRDRLYPAFAQTEWRFQGCNNSSSISCSDEVPRCKLIESNHFHRENTKFIDFFRFKRLLILLCLF